MFLRERCPPKALDAPGLDDLRCPCENFSMIKSTAKSKKSSALYGFVPKNSKVMGKAGLTRVIPQEIQRTKTLPIEPAIALTQDSWGQLEKDLDGCRRCKLHSTRKNIVFGEGNQKARILFIGEGPGEQEDLQGRPFVGRAGQLLTKMIEAMGLKRQDVYIANVVKCRPPDNRYPEPDEVSTCSPFLFRQVGLLKPEIIVTLGKCATQSVLGQEIIISKVRGKIMPFKGSKLIPTFHPSYLLRNPAAKKEVWQDLKLVLKELGLPVPKVGSAP